MTDRTTTPREMPLISVVMPTYDPDPRHLREAIESVRGQEYPRWELCIADDGSSRAGVGDALRRYASADARIRVEFGEHEGISAASNRALATSRGEYVAFLDHDDVITADALLEVARAIDAEPSPDVIYSDQDKLGARGARRAPFLKPDWSPVYVLGAMYVGHLLVVRRSVLEEVGGFDSSFDTIQDYELLLRISERTDRIHHLPRILYSWRAVPGSIAAGESEKPGVAALQARAVTEHLRRRGIAATAEPHPELPHRARLVPEPRDRRPLVSVIAHGRAEPGEIERRVAPALQRTGYPRLEVIAVGEAGAAINHGAARAAGEYLLLLGDDVEVVEADWVERLLTYAEIPSVGVVAPHSLYPDGRVRDAGFALRRWGGSAARNGGVWWSGGSPAEPVMRGLPGDADGYFGSLSCAREVGAVSAACMLVSRSLYRRLGGLGEDYKGPYREVDFCLRARALGLGVISTPSPRIVRHTSSPPGPSEDMLDRALLIDSWFQQLERGDPYLHPRLSASMTEPGSAPARSVPRRLLARVARR